MSARNKSAGGKLETRLRIVTICAATVMIVILFIVCSSLVNSLRGSMDIDENGVVYNVSESKVDVRDVADFSPALVTASRDKASFVVLENDVEVTTTLVSTFADWDIFKKTKEMRSFGCGSYAVDLSGISEDDITLDNKKKTVTVRVPRPELISVEPDFSKTEFEDIERGSFLAFGDITLNAEQQNELQQTITQTMRDELSKQQYLDNAQSSATEALTKLYSPLVSAVDGEYTVAIDYDM